MTGESDDLCFWPNDPDFDGPYGYNVLIIQNRSAQQCSGLCVDDPDVGWR